MTKKTTRNFDKRYGNRVTAVYRGTSLEPAEAQLRTVKLLDAFTQVLTGVVGRECTQEELLGIAMVSGNLSRRHK